MLAPGFEWFVAWRHLRDPERRSWRLLKTGVALTVLAAVAYVGLDAAIQHRHGGGHESLGGWGGAGSGSSWSPSSLSGLLLVRAAQIAVGFLGMVGAALLRARWRRSGRVSKAGTVLAVIGGAGVIAGGIIIRMNVAAAWGVSSFTWGHILSTSKTGAVIALVLGGLLIFVGTLRALFTVFTAISIAGVFLGTGAPIIALSVMSGFEADLKTKIRATKADVVVQAKDDAPFSGWEAVQERVLAVPGVVASMAYVESEVIIKHATNPAGMGIIMRGIDPVRAPKVLDLARTLREGKVDYLSHPESIPIEESDLFRPLPGPMERDAKGKGKVAKKEKKGGDEDGDEDEDEDEDGKRKVVRPVLPGVLLGEELYAHTLRVYLGSDVDIACPMCGVGPSGPMPKLKPFRVAGHFYTGMYEFDSKLAYVALADAQKFLGMQGEVTGLEVHTRTPEIARDVADVIAGTLGDAYEVRSWEELNKGLFMALKLEKIAMFIVLTFILLVASFSVVSTLLMLATEKGREIAILKSMGARSSSVLKIFVAEGFYIGLLGMLLGLTTGIAGCQLLSKRGLPLDPDIYYIQKLPVVMRGTEITLICLAAVGLCCLATLYPAYLASRTRPVDGLRYD